MSVSRGLDMRGGTLLGTAFSFIREWVSRVIDGSPLWYATDGDGFLPRSFAFQMSNNGVAFLETPEFGWARAEPSQMPIATTR